MQGQTSPGPSATLDDWLRWQSALSAVEINPGLERVNDVLERLQIERPRTVLTVGGTNGKGSTVIALEALLRGQGRRTGAYLSPHVRYYGERMRVDGHSAAAQTLVGAFTKVEQARRGVPLTYFEFTTLAALQLFADAAVDAAILEVGLGGRLDAVNCVDHDGCIITNVSLDHCEWLGSDIESIAAEKAGILRAGKPVVFAARDMPDTILEAVRETGAELRQRGIDFDWTPAEVPGRWCWQGRAQAFDDLRLPAMAGRHQVDNAAAALALLEATGDTSALAAADVNEALGRAFLAGRLQLVTARNRRWLLDGAHNAAGAESLAAALADMCPAGDAVAVLGILGDKDASRIVASVLPHVRALVAVPAASPRAIPSAELAGIMRSVSNKPVSEAVDVAAGLEAALAGSHDDGLIVVAGSFYTLGPALEWLDRQEQ